MRCLPDGRVYIGNTRVQILKGMGKPVEYIVDDITEDKAWKRAYIDGLARRNLSRAERDKAVRGLRERTGMTQESLSGVFGISQQTVSRALNPPVTAARILHEEGTDNEVAEVLGVEVSRVRDVRDKAAEKNRREEIARQVETGTHVLVPAVDAALMGKTVDRMRDELRPEVESDVLAELAQQESCLLPDGIVVDGRLYPVESWDGDVTIEIDGTPWRVRVERQTSKPKTKRTVAVRGGVEAGAA